MWCRPWSLRVTESLRCFTLKHTFSTNKIGLCIEDETEDETEDELRIKLTLRKSLLVKTKLLII